MHELAYELPLSLRCGQVIMHRFLDVIEKAKDNFSAYSPDLPGCVATGKTRQQVARNLHGAVEMHVRAMVEDKVTIPKSRSFAEYVAIQ